MERTRLPATSLPGGMDLRYSRPPLFRLPRACAPTRSPRNHARDWHGVSLKNATTHYNIAKNYRSRSSFDDAAILSSLRQIDRTPHAVRQERLRNPALLGVRPGTRPDSQLRSGTLLYR